MGSSDGGAGTVFAAWIAARTSSMVLEAGRRIWEAVRHEWHDRATHVATVVDPQGQAAEMCRVSPLTPGPRLKLMVPVDSPVPLSESKPVTMIR